MEAVSPNWLKPLLRLLGVQGLKNVLARSHSNTIRRVASALLTELEVAANTETTELPKSKRRRARASEQELGRSAPGSGEPDYLKPTSKKYDMAEYDAHHFGRM
jgi:hypothetical protein